MPHAVAAGHHKTLAVAKEVLHAKGNAFDAAIAAYFAMFVAEPCMASAGGNGFALTRTENGQFQFLDFFCQTPQQKSMQPPVDFYPILVDFGGDVEEFHIGLGSAAVPGTIAGIFALHRIHGTMPISELVSPAIQLAKEGVELNWFQALDLALLDPIYSRDESVRHIFYENGKLKKEGDLIQMPALADFLDFIAREGERGFYFGEIAQVIARDSKSRGGFLTRKDFEDYRVNIMNPLVVSYRDKNIILPNGPSKGGALMAVMLGSIKKGADALPGAIKKTQINASSGGKLKFMMDELYEQHNFRLNPSVTASRGTSHFSILDAKGNAVALTSSIGEGCGYFIPGTAMHLNNMMGELFLLPGGAHSWQPDTRMHSMMTPTMVTDEHHALELVSGSGGAGRIPYAIGQVIYHLYQSKMNLKDSTEHPRVHFQDGKMQIELGFEHTLSKDEIVQWDKKSLYFGGVHSIYKGQKRIEAIGDDRREGAGEVF